jgi:hypothetical protein
MSASAGTALRGLDGNALDALTIRNDQLAEWGEPDWTILDDRRGTLPEFPADVLDDRFHEPDHGTGDLLVDSSFAVR